MPWGIADSAAAVVVVSMAVLMLLLRSVDSITAVLNFMPGVVVVSLNAVGACEDTVVLAVAVEEVRPMLGKILVAELTVAVDVGLCNVGSHMSWIWLLNAKAVVPSNNLIANVNVPSSSAVLTNAVAFCATPLGTPVW